MPAFPVPVYECVDFLFNTLDQVAKAVCSLFIQANLVLFSVHRRVFRWA